MRTPKVHTVVNVLIHNREADVLLARRSPRRRRHPGVVSSITARIEHFEAEMLLGTPVPTTLGEHWFANGRVFMLGHQNFGGRLLLEKIFARKLAPVSVVREGRLHGGCQLKQVLVKDVGDPLGQDGTVQRTCMITFEVFLEHGAELLIAKQRYYQEIGWFRPKAFQTAYNTHDPWPLFPHANPWEICIDGACTDGAISVVNQWTGYVGAD